MDPGIFYSKGFSSYLSLESGFHVVVLVYSLFIYFILLQWQKCLSKTKKEGLFGPTVYEETRPIMVGGAGHNTYVVGKQRADRK